VVEFTNAPGRPPRVVLETNPRYFGRQPYINKLEFKYYATPAEAFAAYHAGEVQGIAPITLPADFDLVRSASSLNLFTAPISGLTLIFLNTDDVNSPFFQEKEVRQALLLALDRQAIVDVGLGGQGTVADVPFQPDSWARPDVPHVEQDIGKARTLLDNAGWVSPVKRRDIEDMPLPTSGGSDDLRLKAGVPLSFTLLTSAEQVDVARLVARQWKVIGVNAQVQPVQIGLASNYLQARQYQAAVANILLDTPDPDPYPFWHETRAGSGQNYSQFKDRDLSEVLEASRRVVDRDRRVELYAKFVDMFNEQVPSILLYYPVYSYGVSERIRGVQLGSMLAPSDRFQTLADWFVIERRVIVNSGQFAP
jgi:peptide/nickel transport system substrate-binding protein